MSRFNDPAHLPEPMQPRPERDPDEAYDRHQESLLLAEEKPKRRTRMKAVAKVDKQLPAVATGDQALMALISRAATDPAMDVAKLEKLLEVRERWEATEARKAFNAALAEFKAEAVVIIKKTKVTTGPLEGKYHANLFDVVSAVTPALAKQGLAISWKLTKDDKDWMEVTCTLRHVSGHFESVSMGGAPDTGPGRNAIQSRGSTKSYLERYTATAILGLAAKDQDNDGNSSVGNRMDEGVAADHLAAIDGAATEAELISTFRAAWTAAKAAEDKGAMRLFTEHKDSRKKALGVKS